MTQNNPAVDQALANQIRASVSQRFGEAPSASLLNVSGMDSRGAASALSSRTGQESQAADAYSVLLVNDAPEERDVAIVFKLTTSKEAEAIRQRISSGQGGVFVLTDAGGCETLEGYVMV